MIFNMVGGGGGSGATLVVSSPVNVSVTVSKDDKSYTKNSGSLGSATFKGLATGTWTVTISGNGQTATKTIGITADYAITIAFFSASINITYPATSTCVVTNSSGQTVASDTNTGSSTKTWTATVNATGTYTVTATSTIDGSKTKSATVSITADGQSKSVTLAYELVLYDSGDQHSTVTGGWKNNSGTFALNSDSMALVGGYHTDASAFTNNLVDLTDYNTLYFTLAYNDDGSARQGAIGISTSNTDAAPSYVSSISGINGTFSKTTKSIDISSITGSYYVGFSVIQNEMTVYKVWAV